MCGHPCDPHPLSILRRALAKQILRRAAMLCLRPKCKALVRRWLSWTAYRVAWPCRTTDPCNARAMAVYARSANMGPRPPPCPPPAPTPRPPPTPPPAFSFFSVAAFVVFVLTRRFCRVSELIFRASVMLGSSGTSAGSISPRFSDGAMHRQLSEGKRGRKEGELDGERQGWKKRVGDFGAEIMQDAPEVRAPLSFWVGQGAESDVSRV